MRAITIISILIMILGAVIFDITDFKLTGVLIVIIGFLLDDIIQTDKEDKETEDQQK